MCEIVPKKILKAIAENDPNDKRRAAFKSIVADTKEKEYRKKRKQISQEMLKGVTPDIEKSHTEHIFVYNNKSSWDYIKNWLWEEFIENHTVAKKIPKRLFTRNFDKVYDMFHDILERESFDNDNANVNIFLKYGVAYPNAFWDGEVLAFGEGDKYYFNDFSKVFDVMAHEYGHAITQYECNLQYENQSGALNEHVSDVFGVVAYQRKYNLSVDKTDWIIGVKLFTNKVIGKGLRSFKDEIAYDDPVIGKDDQPKHMDNYQNLPNTEDGDWGGVHTNSGIPNHAFYLFNQKLGGKSWTNGSLEIWYETIKKKNGLSPYATFKEFADKTLDISNQLSLNTRYLEEAWQQVGVL